LGGAKTNDQGEFAFTPREAVDHRFWLDAGAGHGTEQTIAAADLPGSVSAAGNHSAAASGKPGSSPAGNAEISRQIGALSEEVARLRYSIQFRDLVGGIGYIMGLTGLWYYFKARHRPRE
jgi:nickel transport protein